MSVLYENISLLFGTFVFCFFVVVFVDYSIPVRAVVVVTFLFRFRPRPFSKFPTDSDRCFAIMSLGVTSELAF